MGNDGQVSGGFLVMEGGIEKQNGRVCVSE